MRFIRDILAEKKAAGRPAVSFEFFTPKTDEGDRTLLTRTLPALQELKPDFCSVTYGAGGSTQSKTLMLVDRIQKDGGIPAMAHLTCVGATRPQIRQVLQEARSLNIHNILALRGDPPGGVGEFKKVEDGFEFAFELVELLKAMQGFSVGVAGFPEGHMACKEGRQVDWDRLQAKIGCGADFVVTQLFFKNEFFLEMRDYLDRKGLKTPILPGIIPIQSATQIKRFTTMCGAHLPPALVADLERLGDDESAATEYGIDYATRQCAELVREGVPGLHFYTLNKAPTVSRIVTNLNLA